ncbi:MAG TPA: histidine kinase dimerization/phospho-acceptor domain-containing protein, partial [Candidatus Limnocylindrales bacterium]
MTPPEVPGVTPGAGPERPERGDQPPGGGYGGPPWAWRADHGRYGPWERRDPRYREMRRRARLYRRAQAQGLPWHRRQGFGCIFAILFLIVIGSIVTATATILSRLGPIPVVIAVLAIAGIATALLRGVAGAARDLDAMLAATRRVEEGDYGVRLRRTRSDLAPIQELARGFDTMTARLEADEEQRRTLLADVSHELRTPLAVITGNLEAIIDGVYPPDPAHLTPILDETRVMERLIEDLRTVTLSEAGTLALHPEPTDPDILIAEVLHVFAPGAAAAGVTLVSNSADDMPILDIDPVRIREVLSNLVANALRHTPAGGSI